MSFGRFEVLPVTVPKNMWLFLILGIILASEIAVALSFAFLLLFSHLALDENVLLFLVSAPFVSLLIGLPGWRLFMVKSNHITIRRGVFWGLLSGIVTHPLVLICCTTLSSLLGRDFIIHLIVSDPLLEIVLAVDFSVFSLFYVGWITATVGGITGGLLIYLQIVLVRRTNQQSNHASLTNG